MKKAKAMAAKVKSSKPEQKPKKYPVPQWMDESLKPTAEKLDVVERHKLAAELEHQAAQLREMNPPEIKSVATATVQLRPNEKEALLIFANRFGAGNCKEQDKLNSGARWFLQIMLARLNDAISETSRFSSYRDAEGLKDSVYSEKLIGDAIEIWKEKSASDDDEGDEVEA